MPREAWWKPTRPLTKAETEMSGSFAEDREASSRLGVDEHPVTRFHEELAGLDRYPAGVVRVPRPIDGTAFFSAGPGLYCDQPPSVVGLPRFPHGGMMFVGHNLDAEEPYRRRLESGVPHGDRSHPMRTWRGLYKLLDIASVDPRFCFFTNAYVGLIAGNKPTGRFPGSSDPGFTSWCEDFLRLQISVMEPAAIVGIGADARRFLGRLIAELSAWRKGPSLAVSQAELDGRAFAGLALAHPSMYPASARGRAFAGKHGIEADAALLRAAL